MGTRLKLAKRWIAQRLPWRKPPPPPPIVPRPEIFPKVRECLMDSSPTIRRSEVLPEARLYNDLGIDSLGAIQAVMLVEEEFGIKIPDEEAEKLTTVQDILRCVEGKLQNAQWGAPRSR